MFRITEIHIFNLQNFLIQCEILKCHLSEWYYFIILKYPNYEYTNNSETPMSI